MSARLTSSVVLALAVGGCADRPQTILPGMLDFTVPEGARLADDCHTMDHDADAYHLSCIVIARVGADAVIDDFTQQLAGKGFVTGGAAGSALWTHRTASADCIQRLFLVANDYPRAQGQSEEVSLTFAAERRERCGADREAPQ